MSRQIFWNQKSSKKTAYFRPMCCNRSIDIYNCVDKTISWSPYKKQDLNTKVARRRGKRTCSSVINFSATLGSWLGVALDPWWLAWLVAGHEGWRAPQNAAAGFPPIESIMFEPCTCIIVHIYSRALAFSSFHQNLIHRLVWGQTGASFNISNNWEC